jgi:4-carboxymuconolactone decarboxylase
MLSALDGVDSQLQSHFRVSMRVGITLSQLDDFITVVAAQVDHNAANRANAALNPLRATQGQ